MNIPRLQKQPIDTFLYSQMIHPKKPELNFVERIRRFIIIETGIDPYEDTNFMGAEFVRARQLFMYFVRRHTKLSQYATGRLLGKDHSTVVHAEKCVAKFKSIEPLYCEVFDSIEQKIKQLKSNN